VVDDLVRAAQREAVDFLTVFNTPNWGVLGWTQGAGRGQPAVSYAARSALRNSLR
jgi:hypothetical protein